MSPRQAVHIKVRRSASDVAFGLLAVLALAGLIGGVPYALVRYFGSPLPDGGFSLSMLTQDVGLSSVLDMLAIVVWLAWAQLVACVVVELIAGIRRVGVPARVPFASGPQALAHRLVTAALLLFAATAVVAPAVQALAPATPHQHTAVVAQQAPQTEKTENVEQAREALAPVQKTKKVYVVQPPHGRHHESLWEIAEKCLGEGRRYKEIYQLNQHREQPDGTRLRMADLIRVGWVLDMPDDAINVHVVSQDQDRPETLHRHADKPVELDGHTHYAQASAEDSPEVTRPAVKTGGTGGAGGSEAAPTVQEAPDAGDPEMTAVVKAHQQDAESTAVVKTPQQGTDSTASSGVVSGVAESWPDFLAAASLAAAGLLAVLGSRRRRQLWDRAFGSRLPNPEGEAAVAEMALLLGADPHGSRLLDVGLRHLSKELAKQGRTPPTVFAAFLASTHLDLWIHPPEKEAPAPWAALDGGRIWRLTANDGHRLPDLPDIFAPYPGLVSLGTSDAGRVLVDLEAAQGLINLRGRSHVVSAALAAMAVELATNRWSDHMRLVLVGFGEELSLIAPDRISVHSTLAEALPELEARAADVSRALQASGVSSVLTGRSRGVYGEAWMPVYLLTAVPPTEGEAARLAELAQTGTRLASGYLVAGEEIRGASWTWELSPDGRARVGALGLDVHGQLLPQQQYAQVIQLFRAAGQPGVAMDDPEPSGPAASQLHPGFRPAVDVRVLGSVEVIGPRPLEEERLPLCMELVAYVATHPGGVHPQVLAGALWPRGVEAPVRDATIARTREWLGIDSEGRSNLFADDQGRLHLGPEVRVDWLVFRELVRLSRTDPATEAARLGQALDLVRGPFLHGHPAGRYLWLAGDELVYEVSARVSDAARRLTQVLLAAGDPARAMTAAQAGLRMSDEDEPLWRELLRAAHATGDVETLRHWVESLRRWAATSRYQGRLVPETEALIQELLPAPARAAG
ncbi:bacterial transcriptional activator domain-containing protein [Planotetraspora phitsanulokensis]|nr:bacterial transcriptional activator domain-containing protein [Planotetraspora phitsanulokensis]